MVTSKKIKTAFFCSQCGAEHSKWQGQCRECSEWNTLVEEKIVKSKAKSISYLSPTKSKLPDITFEQNYGYKSEIKEFDRVLGGQLLPGMAVLLGGEPGIGKSTLLLQAADAFSKQGLSVLYVTGEESPAQLKIRSQRLKVNGDNITVVTTTSLEEIQQIISSDHYAIVLIDSIQTISSTQFDSPPGTVSQIREAAYQLINFTKAKNSALFLVGHVTKDGMVAGPKLLEHMVDTVIYFEGDQTHLYRMLRATKNRFGSVSEIGLFEMKAEGLIEVTNPSSLFLADHTADSRTGSTVTAICEGSRPILVEIQALVTSANYGTPQRVAGGIDNKRLALLLAILEKRCGYPMGANDVFVSVAGGLKITEPSVDLAVMTAIVSSLLNKSINPKTLIVGEVGLSGEVRGVAMIDRRLNEARKMGFEQVVIPKSNQPQTENSTLQISPVDSLQTAIDLLVG